MNPKRVRTRQEIEALLRSKGLEPTDHVTATGRFWKSIHNGRHVQVPHAIEDMYPEFLLDDLRGRLDELGFGALH